MVNPSKVNSGKGEGLKTEAAKSAAPTTAAGASISRGEVEAELGAALEATFPASDPVAVAQPTATEPDRPLDRKPAVLDRALVDELADTVRQTHENEPRRRA